jgi:hypothetical protein
MGTWTWAVELYINFPNQVSKTHFLGLLVLKSIDELKVVLLLSSSIFIYLKTPLFV